MYEAAQTAVGYNGGYTFTLNISTELNRELTTCHSTTWLRHVVHKTKGTIPTLVEWAWLV